MGSQQSSNDSTEQKITASNTGKGIQISITVGDSKDDPIKLTLKGSDTALISSTERETFGIQDGPLKEAAYKYEGGKPTDVFVRGPTPPWGDVFSKYGWAQVERTIIPKSVRVIGTRTEPIIVDTQEFVNNSSVKTKYNASINRTVQESVSSTWTKCNNISTSNEVSFSFGFNEHSVSAGKNLTFTSSWEEQKQISQEVTLGSVSGLEIDLEPGQAVVSTLSASRVTMDVEVVYTASLDGMVFCNYHNGYNGHNFWAYPVNNVLKAADLPLTVDSKQVLKIMLYSKCQITVSDS